nr:basic salivary proline-rich protein 2-like [Taeniopygia guttata]
MEHVNFGSGCRTPLLPSRLPSKPVKQATADAKTRRCPTSNKGGAQPCRRGSGGEELSGPGSGPGCRPGQALRTRGKGSALPARGSASADGPRPSPRLARRHPTLPGPRSRRRRLPAAPLLPPRPPAEPVGSLLPGHSGGSSGAPRSPPGPETEREPPHAPSAPPTARARKRGRGPRAHTCPPSPPRRHATQGPRGTARGRAPRRGSPRPRGESARDASPPRRCRDATLFGRVPRESVFPRGGAGREPHGKPAIPPPPPPRAPGAEGRERGREGQLRLRQAALPPPPGSGCPASGPAPGVSHPRGPCPFPSCRRRRCCQRSLN